jgi:hypothetical protein
MKLPQKEHAKVVPRHPTWQKHQRQFQESDELGGRNFSS